MASTLAAERFWVDKANFHNAERQYYEYLSRELAELKPSSHESQLEYSQEQPRKSSKTAKALKPRINGSGVKILDASTTESEENVFLSTSLSTAPLKMVECSVTKSGGEKTKKRNKGKKGTEVLYSNSQIFAEQKSNGGSDSSHTKGSISTTKFRKTLTDSKNKGTTSSNQCTLVSEIAKAREHIKNSLEKMDGIATLAAAPVSTEILDRVAAVERDNADLRNLVENLKLLCLESQSRITELENQLKSPSTVKSDTTVKAGKGESMDDDEVDLFGSDSEGENEEAERIREQRLAAYAAKKSKKPALIAKSNIILDVKPWDDETNLGIMESSIRKIECDGLLWGASKIVPVAYGIQKLSISCVVEDDKVSIDWLTEEIEKLEDYVQSVDIVAFNKI